MQLLLFLPIFHCIALKPERSVFVLRMCFYPAALQCTSFSSTPNCIAFLCRSVVIEMFCIQNLRIFLPGYVFLCILLHSFRIEWIYRVSDLAWNRGLQLEIIWLHGDDVRNNMPCYMLYYICMLWVMIMTCSVHLNVIRRIVFVSNTFIQYPLVLLCFELLISLGALWALTYICGTLIAQYCSTHVTKNYCLSLLFFCFLWA